MNDLWVFGYGSLIWRPGFTHRAAYPARLFGFHRSLCVYSHVHRGTPERPGLVMGLDRGGSCQGVAYHVDAAHADEVLRYLREREQATMVYQERVQPVHLLERSKDAPQRVGADLLCRPAASTICRSSVREDQLSIVRGGVGQSGKNPEYVIETSAALERLGVHDATLHWLATRLADEA